MAIKDVMEAIKSSLENINLVGISSISFNSSQLTFDRLKDDASSQPQVFIHCSSFSGSKQDEAPELFGYDLAASVQFSISILSENTGNNVNNDLVTRLLSEAIVLHLVDQDWGLENCLPATELSSRPLFPELESTNQDCNIWLVSWTQVIGLNKNEVQNDINDWLSYHADHHNSDNEEQILASADVEIHSS